MSQIFPPFANKPKSTHRMRSEKATTKIKESSPSQKCPLRLQGRGGRSQVNVILTKDNNNLLTANAAAVNNMSNIQSRSECTHASKEIFMIPVEKTPPSTQLRAKSKVRQMENMLETVLGLSNENIPSLFTLTIWYSQALEVDDSKSPLALGANPP